MRALVIGGNSYLGSALVSGLEAAGWETIVTTRQTCDLLSLPETLPAADVVYICAASTRFIDCESDQLAYRTNVDAPIKIAQLCAPAKIVYLSSEAVERALHTNYGMHKALAEVGLRAVCNPLIVRLSKVIPQRLDKCIQYLVGLTSAPPGVYHWP